VLTRRQQRDAHSALLECFGLGSLDLLPDSKVELAGAEPDDVTEVANEPVRELLVVDLVLKTEQNIYFFLIYLLDCGKNKDKIS
jgi:hypothetical protein